MHTPLPVRDTIRMPCVSYREGCAVRRYSTPDRSRWQTRLAEEEENKWKSKKNHTKDTTTTQGITRAISTEDISVSLGDTGIVVTRMLVALKERRRDAMVNKDRTRPIQRGVVGLWLRI